MAPSSLWPYQRPSDHAAVSAIIRRRSSNQRDVREVALGDLDLSFARDVLDLGCGFGFMAEALAPHVASDARVLGVDVWASNKEPFLESVAAGGRTGCFECLHVDSKLPWPDRCFDLVICSYALYFFPDVLPDIARVLAPHGLFLAVTHSEDSFLGMLHAVGLDEMGSRLLALMRKFSAENGGDRLSRWFGEVTRINYHNCLRFQAEHADELLTYLRFKLPFLVPCAQQGEDLPAARAEYARVSLSRLGAVVVEKNDAIFWCRRPRCP